MDTILGSGNLRICPLCNSAAAADLCPVDGTATIRWIERAPLGLPREGDVVSGRYRIEATIGAGGFGAVYRVIHTGTGQACALKVLAFSGDSHHQAVRRFFAEARATAGLKHNNTVRVFDFGQDDRGWPFLAMELLVGKTLSEWLARRRSMGAVMNQAEAVHVGVSVLRSLIEAHEAGIVHRDLKPPNIFLHTVGGDDPVVKVLDFGIAKSAEFALTQNHQALGTPMYMSPEQCMSEPVDGRSDLYALGCILYQMVVGKPPFSGDSVGAIVLKHVGGVLPDLAQTAKTPLTPEFVAVVNRALQKDPDQRFRSASHMRDALKVCAATSEMAWSWGELAGAVVSLEAVADVSATTGWQGMPVDRPPLPKTVEEKVKPVAKLADADAPSLPLALPRSDEMAAVSPDDPAPATARYGPALAETAAASRAGEFAALAAAPPDVTVAMPEPSTPTAAVVTGGMPSAAAPAAVLAAQMPDALPVAVPDGRARRNWPALAAAVAAGAAVAWFAGQQIGDHPAPAAAPSPELRAAPAPSAPLAEPAVRHAKPAAQPTNMHPPEARPEGPAGLAAAAPAPASPETAEPASSAPSREPAAEPDRPPAPAPAGVAGRPRKPAKPAAAKPAADAAPPKEDRL